MAETESNSDPTSEVVYEKTSLLLRRTSADISGDKIPLGVLLDRLRRRSFGGLLFFLSVLSLIPGVSIFSGIFMAVLGFQLFLGFKAPVLPRFISEYGLNVNHLKTIVNSVIPKIESIEKYIKPRLLIFTMPPFPPVLGALIFFLAVVAVIPLPFTNLLPALAILLISLGILERDGLLVLLATLFSLLAFTLAGFAVYLTGRGLETIL